MSAERPTALRGVHAALAALELARLGHRRDLREHLRLSDDEVSALLYVERHAGVTQRRLSAVTGLSRSGAGAMLQRLEERGYVRRWSDAHDRRLRLIELTESGQAALDRASNAWHGSVDTALSDATAEEIDAFTRVLVEIAGGANGATVPVGAVDDGAEPVWRHWG
jgi:DNA-binding MarR family transcriptional regulator